MNTGSIGLSLVLIAVGAVLTWAVEATLSGLDIQVVGVILMLAGLGGLVFTLLFWTSFAPFGPGADRQRLSNPVVHRSDLERQNPVVRQSDLERSNPVVRQSDLERGNPVVRQSDLERGNPVVRQSDLERDNPVVRQDDLPAP